MSLLSHVKLTNVVCSSTKLMLAQRIEQPIVSNEDVIMTSEEGSTDRDPKRPLMQLDLNTIQIGQN